MTQPILQAASVIGYRFVTPWIRVLRDAANSLSAVGVKFDFLSAPYLASPDDVDANGEVFVDLGYTVNVTPVVAIQGAAINGAIFTQAPVAGKIPPIESPGGLLLWRCTNLDAARTSSSWRSPS